MNDTHSPLESEHVWSVFDFVRRYRLAKDEENRLLTLYGPTASFRDLLENARRHSPAS
jgi:hypothetical protein